MRVPEGGQAWPAARGGAGLEKDAGRPGCPQVDQPHNVQKDAGMYLGAEQSIRAGSG